MECSGTMACTGDPMLPIIIGIGIVLAIAVIALVAALIARKRRG